MRPFSLSGPFFSKLKKTFSDDAIHRERLGHRKADWTTQLQVVVADITVCDIVPETQINKLFLEGRNLHGAEGSQNDRGAWISKEVEGGLQGTIHMIFNL